MELQSLLTEVECNIKGCQRMLLNLRRQKKDDMYKVMRDYILNANRMFRNQRRRINVML